MNPIHPKIKEIFKGIYIYTYMTAQNEDINNVVLKNDLKILKLKSPDIYRTTFNAITDVIARRLENISF